MDELKTKLKKYQVFEGEYNTLYFLDGDFVNFHVAIKLKIDVANNQGIINYMYQKGNNSKAKIVCLRLSLNEAIKIFICLLKNKIDLYHIFQQLVVYNRFRRTAILN